MAKAKPPKLPIGPLRDLVAWWKAANLPVALIGGLAVALHTKSRTTEDVYAVIAIELADLNRVFKARGFRAFSPRVPDLISFAKETRMILLTHNSSQIDIDLSIAGTPFEMEAIRRARPAKVGRIQVPLVTTEDLIIFKLIANRPIDIVDVARLVEFDESLDITFVRSRLKAFGELLERPEMLSEFERIVAHQSRLK